MRAILPIFACLLLFGVAPALSEEAKDKVLAELDQIEGSLKRHETKTLEADDYKSLLERLKVILSESTLEPNQKAKALYLRAMVEFENRDMPGARADIDESLKLLPKYKEALSYRGLINTLTGKPEQALADFTSAIEAGANEPYVFSNRGSVYSQMGKSKEALADFDKAIELSKDDTQTTFARAMRANVLADLKEYDKAIADCDYVLTRPMPQELLDGIHKRKGGCLFFQNKFKESIKELTLAIEKSSDAKLKASAVFMRGAAYDRLGEKEKALSDLFLARKLGFVTSNPPPDRVVEESPELKAKLAPLTAKARKSLPQVKARFLKGLPSGSFLAVTTTLSGPEGKERVFVKVLKWQGNKISGKLSNHVRLSNYKYGAPLNVQEDQVLDWTIVDKQGKEEGNLLGKFLDEWLDKHK
ncbi:MAG: tetratricopeptide repeat protein [Candidatus Melainabacteria bacterium]|nr:tetratricopeptide repeat protein [Candidatus Melainabacteria bacterium]